MSGGFFPTLSKHRSLSGTQNTAWAMLYRSNVSFSATGWYDNNMQLVEPSSFASTIAREQERKSREGWWGGGGWENRNKLRVSLPLPPLRTMEIGTGWHLRSHLLA